MQQIAQTPGTDHAQLKLTKTAHCTKIGKPGSQPILPSFLFVIRAERNKIKILLRYCAKFTIEGLFGQFSTQPPLCFLLRLNNSIYLSMSSSHSYYTDYAVFVKSLYLCSGAYFTISKLNHFHFQIFLFHSPAAKFLKNSQICALQFAARVLQYSKNRKELVLWLRIRKSNGSAC